MKNNFFSKYGLLTLVTVFMLLVSACGAQEPTDGAIQTAIAQTAMAEAPAENADLPAGMPAMPSNFEDNEEGYGRIGVLASGLHAEGEYWMPTNDAYNKCLANPDGSYVVPARYTANGKKYTADCTSILKGYAYVGMTQEEAKVSLAPTATPRATNTPLVENTAVPTHVSALPTATLPAQSDGQAAYNNVVSLCESGLDHVTLGFIVVDCSDPMLPAPVSFTDAPTGHRLGNITTNGECMTNGEMSAAHGFNQNGVKALADAEDVPWEGCGKWVVQAVGIGLYYQPFLKGWEYTVTEANGKVTVNVGPGGEWVWGATSRQLETYTSPDQQWVHDHVLLMVREFNYGFDKDPRYATFPGVNLNLRGLWHQPSLDATCPAKNDTVQAAALLGGDDPAFWTAPDWERGAWVFNSKGNGFHHMTWTGEPGFFDVWTAENGAVQITNATEAKLFNHKRFEEASYHCLPE